MDGIIFLKSKTIVFSGYEESSVSSVTDNNTYQVTTWSHPWPPHIHWLDPYLNLSSFSRKIIDAIVLGDKLKKEIRYHSDPYYEWIIDFRTDGDLADSYYNKYYANSTENMLMCTPLFPKLINKIRVPYTNLDFLICVNYTVGMWDWQKRKGQWKYMWKTYKYRMTGMFVLAGAVFITGFMVGLQLIIY